MIHAFFNIRLDDAYLAERTGQFVEDADEARAVARTIIRRLVVQHGGEPRLLNAVMVVTDAAGASVLDLSFFEALYVPVAAPERVGSERMGPERMGPERMGPERMGSDLPRLSIRAPGKWGAAFAVIAARMRTLPMHPRFGAAFLQVRAHLATIADGLSFRRDPRQRFRLGLEPGR